MMVLLNVENRVRTDWGKSSGAIGSVGSLGSMGSSSMPREKTVNFNSISNWNLSNMIKSDSPFKSGFDPNFFTVQTQAIATKEGKSPDSRARSQPAARQRVAHLPIEVDCPP